MLTVFLLSFIHLWGLSTMDINNQAVISDYGDYHLVYFYPLENCMKESLFALFLLFKSFRFHTCVYTKIATWMYTLLSLLSLAHVIFVFDYGIYFSVFQYFLLYGMITMFFFFLFSQRKRIVHCIKKIIHV